MSDQQRQKMTFELLEEKPRISVGEISVATARRDPDKLDEAGLSQKVHSGIAAFVGTARLCPVTLHPGAPLSCKPPAAEPICHC